MIVNLYVDHMMSRPPASAEEVWNETREHAKLFADAANRIGLTPAEYREFRLALLDGRVQYVTLPRRLDAMSGNRRGSVYAVKNAYMTSTIQGWRVALADGNVVYVPKVCGNISMLRHAAIAQHVVRPPKRVAYAHHHKPRFVPAIGSANETPVTPVAVAPPAAVAAAPVAAAAVPAAATAAHGVSPFLFFIPAVIGGIIGSQPHHTTPPPCNRGSNSMGVCTK